MANLDKFYAPRGGRVMIMLLASILGISVNFPEGYSNTYPNTALHSFKEFLNGTALSRGYQGGLSEEAYIWVWTSILNVWHLGFLIGNLLIPFFAERFGRKSALLYAACVSLCSTVLLHLAILLMLPELFFIARISSSIAGGLSFGTLIIFLQETTPTNLRGVASFLAEVTFLLCTVVGMGAGMDRVFGRNLIALTGLAIIPGVICVGTILPLHETPKYLLLGRHDEEAAREAVEFYYGDEYDADEVLKEIQKEGLDGDEKFNFYRGIRLIFSEPYLRMPYLIGLASLQLVMGLFPIIYLSTNFLEEMFEPAMAQLASFGFILVQFGAGICGTFVVSRCGRRPLLLGLGAMNISSFILYILFERLFSYYGGPWGYGCILALCIFGFSYGLGLGPISCFITSELVVQRYRSLVQSMMYVTNTLISLVVSYLVLPAYTHFGCLSFLVLFVIPSLFAFAYLYINLPETKDREIHEIVGELKERVGCCTASRSFSESSSTNNITSEETPLTKQKTGQSLLP